MPTSFKEDWRANALLLLGGIAAALALAELAVRASGRAISIEQIDTNGRGLYEADAELGYRMRANAEVRFQRPEFSTTIKTNAQGYRDDDFSVPPGAGPIIVGLGDSFGFGHGVAQHESFYEIAEAALRRQWPGARIDNLSVTGYATFQQRKQIPLAARLGARVAVLAFCTGNDILENGGIIARGIGIGNQRTTTLAAPPDGGNTNPSPRPWLETHSHLWRLFNARLGARRGDLDVGGPVWYAFDQQRRTPSAKTEAAYAATTRELIAFFDDCRARSIYPYVVIIPPLYTLVPSQFAAAARAQGFAPDEFELRSPDQMVGRTCLMHEVSCFDAAQLFQSDPARFYFPQDGHLNAAGHAALGEALAAILATELGPRTQR